MKKILALVMAMTMGMGLVACGSSTSADTAAADTATETTERSSAMQFSLMSRMHRVIPIPVLLSSTALFQKERT